MALPHPDGNFDADVFARMVDENRAGSPDPPVEAPSPLKIHLPADTQRLEGGGGDKRWRSAMAWVGATEDRAPAAPLTELAATLLPAAADAVAVKRELGLDQQLSSKELSARWRDFLWRNHPDRLPAESRAGANARVAMANALRDQARRGR